MKIHLNNPVWTHFPAAAVLIYFIIRLIGAEALPAQAPVHYDLKGIPDGFGSPWSSLALTLGLSILFIGVSFIIDETWARQEKRKTFNWLSLFDEITVGFLVGVSAGYLDSLQSGTFTFPTTYTMVLAGGATLLAIVLEVVRPYRPSAGQLNIEDTSILAAELNARLKDNLPFLYWESQNPFYFNLLSIVLPVLLLVGAIQSLSSNPWIALMLFVLGIPFLLFYGGMRTIVHQKEITVRFGLTGFKALQVKTADIAQLEICHFSALNDFGGYGLRFSRKNNITTKAFFLRGSQGVKITTRQGKQYLIGSDKPEHLLTVMKATSGVA
jgi:hypothetical protein